jgi:DNA-binding response OmpR family regulator
MLLDPTRPRALLIEDDEDIRAIVRVLLASFEVLEARTGGEGLRLAFADPVDVIILDRRLPDGDGLELLAALRRQLTTRHVPVIMLTAQAGLEDRVAGLQQGADDYLAKPFEPAELLARVEGIVRRTRDALVTDPLTKLPGNAVLRAEIARYLREARPFALCYVDLNSFKAYVDHYGFERASLLIQRLAQLCYSSLVDFGAPEDFLGHLGGDDFFFLVGPGRVDAVVDHLLAAFDALVSTFYDEPDRARGHIEGTDRDGSPKRYGLTSLSVAVIDVAPGDFPDPGALGSYAAKCKSAVKGRRGTSSNSAHFSRAGGATP